MKIITVVYVCAAVIPLIFVINFILTVDIRTGKLYKPRVIYGSVKEGMVSAKACGEALYLHEEIRPGLLRPIPDNVHDVLFFPVTPGDLASYDMAVLTYNPWYPFWAGAEPFFDPLEYERLKSGWDAAEYKIYQDNIKYMIIGNGLFSKRYGDYELWYKPINGNM